MFFRPATGSHRWTFFRVGGFDQVRLSSAADLAHLDQLDQKLWAALTCPVKNLEFDERTLALIDLDGDGRVRAPEILAAVQFCKDSLKSLDGMLAGKEELPLGLIDDSKPVGKAMLGLAQHILARIGKSTATVITAADIEKVQADLAKTRFNGDGVLPPATSDDPTVQQAITDIMTTCGSAKDRSGTDGITEEGAKNFFTACAEHLAWWGAGAADPETWPLGEGTGAALMVLDAVRPKILDYFARCRLAEYDPRAEQALNQREDQYLALAATDMSITKDEIAGFPLAMIAPARALPLTGPVNPGWSTRLEAFRTVVVVPLAGVQSTLNEAQFAALEARFAKARAWLAAAKGTVVAGLGVTRLRALAAAAMAGRIAALFTQDKAMQAEFDAVIPLERLVHLHRDFFRLCHNFINFADFYSPDRAAIFQAGTLFVDSRACELCVKVEDAAKHAALGGLAKTYLAYCDCTRPGGLKMTIAVAITAGDSDFLMVGRNGLFYDRKGRDWDATITKVVENPISVRQAFWSPYKKAIRFVEEMVAKRAASADETANVRLSNGITEASSAASTGAKTPPKPKIDLSIIALLGVAVSGATAVLGAVLQSFFGLGYLMPLGLLGLLLAISGPSMIIAALKLRQRNLGPILDANGWAINGRVKINIPFGGSLTALPILPANAKRSLIDPYAEKQTPWGMYITVTLLVLVVAGLAADRYLRPGAKDTWVWERPPFAEAPTATGAAIETATGAAAK